MRLPFTLSLFEYLFTPHCNLPMHHVRICNPRVCIARRAHTNLHKKRWASHFRFNDKFRTAKWGNLERLDRKFDNTAIHCTSDFQGAQTTLERLPARSFGSDKSSLNFDLISFFLISCFVLALLQFRRPRGSVNQLVRRGHLAADREKNERSYTETMSRINIMHIPELSQEIMDEGRRRRARGSNLSDSDHISGVDLSSHVTGSKNKY